MRKCVTSALSLRSGVLVLSSRSVGQIMLRFVLACLLASAAASVLPRPDATPLLKLRGGAYPAPKAGYHMLAAKGAAATTMPVVPNLLSGGLAGAYVAVRRRASNAPAPRRCADRDHSRVHDS